MNSLGIIGHWSAEHERNVFRIRGTGERYDSLYQWLNGPKCSARSVHNDWPWDYIVFDDPFHEQSFLIFYQDDIEFDTEPGCEYRPLPPNLKPLGWIPHDQRVPGESYLEPCGHYHTWNTLPKGKIPEDTFIESLSAEIAAKIDAEILEELLELAKK